MEDEPAALKFFKAMPKSWQHYFSKWIDSAKTDPTKTKRIAFAVSSLAKKMNFSEMIRAQKKRQGRFDGVMKLICYTTIRCSHSKLLS